MNMQIIRRVSSQLQARVVPILSTDRHFSTSTIECQEIKSFESIPGPPRLPLIGHLHLFSKYGPYSMDRLQDAFQDLHKKYGNIIRVDLGIKMILLFRPEYAQKLYSVDPTSPARPVFEALKYYRNKRKDIYSCAGLVTENGAEWKRLRDGLNFMMRLNFSHSYFKGQEKIADDFVLRIKRRKDSEGQIPNFLQEIYRYTEEAIGLVCFGMRLGVLNDTTSNDDFSAKLTQAADDTMQGLASTLLGFPWWKMFNTKSYKKLVSSQDFFQSFASECVDKAALKLKDPKYENALELEFFRNVFQNEKLSKADITLLMTEIFSAGIDATGNTIGYILYNLTKRPEIQDRLHAEIKRHTSEGAELSPKVVERMKFLYCCVRESYRLTPTAGGNARILSSPTVIAGYHIPKDILCIVQNPIICLQEENFQNALEFMPERWYQGEDEYLKTVGHPYSILPFSHGMRKCIGQRFAEQEIRLAILKIIENFRVEYKGPPIGIINRMSLIPDKPLNFIFTER